MRIDYKPNGVCAKKIMVDIEDGVIKEVEFVGGCDGNLQGVAKLAKNRKAAEIMALLEGVRCGTKHTSCPQQLALAIEQALKQE